MRASRAILGFLVCGALLACSNSSPTPATSTENGESRSSRAEAGEGCKRTADCAFGLRCIAWFCREEGYLPLAVDPPVADAGERGADAAPSQQDAASGVEDSGPAPRDASAPSDSGAALDATLGWEDDGWRPRFEGSGGCQGAFHRDDQSGECVPDDPGRFDAEQACWNGGQTNSEGVGRPCHPEERPCEGLAASCCKVDAKLYGAICVTRCPGGQVDCPPDSWCHRQKQICMPPVCQELFDRWYPTHRYMGELGFPCGTGAANETGVGTTCTLMGEQCAGLPLATECLGDRTILASGGAGRTSFCTFTCESAADCGEGAECVYSNGPPFFCAPTHCAAFFEGKIFRRYPAASGPICE